MVSSDAFPHLPAGILLPRPRCRHPGTQPEGVTQEFSGQPSVKPVFCQ